MPVIRNQGDVALQSVQPAMVIDGSGVQSLGAVDFRSALKVGAAGVPNDITIVFENNTASPVTFIFGDANGVIQGVLGLTYLKPVAPASAIGAVEKTIANNPCVIKSLNYRITTGTSGQFSNRFQYATADMDGRLQLIPLNIQSAQRNTQQNDKILTLAQDIPMDDTTGIILAVAANSEVQIDVSFGSIYRPGAF